MSLVSVLVWIEDARWTFAQLYINQRVRSRCAVKLYSSVGLVDYVCDGANFGTSPVSLVSNRTFLFRSAVWRFIFLQVRLSDIRISFQTKVVSIQVRDLLMRNLWHVVAHWIDEHRICALPDVDLSELWGACANTSPLHPFKPSRHWLVSAWTSRCLSSIYDFEINDCSFVEVGNRNTVKVFLVPATTRVKPRSKQVL